MAVRDETQGARSAEAETCQQSSRGFERRATRRFARTDIYPAFSLVPSGFLSRWNFFTVGFGGMNLSIKDFEGMPDIQYSVAGEQ